MDNQISGLLFLLFGSFLVLLSLWCLFKERFHHQDPKKFLKWDFTMGFLGMVSGAILLGWPLVKEVTRLSKSIWFVGLFLTLCVLSKGIFLSAYPAYFSSLQVRSVFFGNYNWYSF